VEVLLFGGEDENASLMAGTVILTFGEYVRLQLPRYSRLIAGLTQLSASLETNYCIT